VKELAVLSSLVSGDTTELDLDSAVGDGDGSEAASQDIAILISCLAKNPYVCHLHLWKSIDYMDFQVQGYQALVSLHGSSDASEVPWDWEP
jgi:hypothetical protein